MIRRARPSPVWTRPARVLGTSGQVPCGGFQVKQTQAATSASPDDSPSGVELKRGRQLAASLLSP